MSHPSLGWLSAALLTVALVGAASAHVTLETAQAPSNSTYKAVLRVPHGCAGAATLKVRVQIPEGFIGVKPMPKAGWSLKVEQGPYATPFDNHGKEMTSGAREISWSGGELADDWYDEFIIRGTVGPEVAPGTVLYFAAGLLYYFANSPIMLIMARVINGVGFACCSVCLATWMSLLLPIRHMGAGMGLYGTMNALAMAVGPALGIRAQKYIGYRLTFLSSLVLAVIMLIATLMVKNGGQPVRKKQTSITENPSTAVDIDGSASATKKHRFSIRSILEPRVVPLSLTFMMFAIAYFANQSFIVNYVQSRHLPVSSDLFFMFYAVALLVLRLGLRDLFDSKGFRFWLTVCSLGMLAMLACMTFLFNDWMLLLAAIFTAVGYGLMSSVTQAQAVVIAGRERSGIANSTYYAGIDLGMSVGPFVGGLVYGRLSAVWFYPVFMLAMPVAWLIYLLCVKRVSR